MTFNPKNNQIFNLLEETKRDFEFEKKREPPLKLYFVTDPFCISSWAMIPDLKKLKEQFSEFISLEFKMGGLISRLDLYKNNGIQSPKDIKYHWQTLAKKYEAKISGEVWENNPPHSSYPPSIAFKAAQLQSEKKAFEFYSRIQKMLFFENKNICEFQVLQKAIVKSGLSKEVFTKDYRQLARQNFEVDLEWIEKHGIEFFPTLVFESREREVLRLEGYKEYGEIKKNIKILLNSIWLFE